MTKFKKIIITSVTIATIAAGSVAFADRGKGDRQERMVERITKKLELNETQSDALSTFASELSETRELMRGKDSDLKSEMTALISTDTFDQTQALTLINDRLSALQANAPELVSAAATFFDGLNAEQKEEFRTLAEKRGNGRHDRHDKD